MFDPLGDLVSGVLESVDDLLDDLFGKVSEPFETLIADATATLNQSLQRIGSFVSQPIKDATELLDSLGTRLLPNLQSLLQTADSIVASVTRKSTLFIDDLMGRGSEFLDDLASKTSDTFLEVLKASDRILKNVDAKVRDGIDAATTFAVAGVEVVSGKLEAFRVDIDKALSGLPEAIGKIADKAGEKITGVLDTGLKAIVSSFFEALAPDLTDRVDGIISMIEDDPDLPDAFKHLTHEGGLPVLAVGGLIAAFLVPMLLSSYASSQIAPWAERARQKQNISARPTLLPPQPLRDQFAMNPLSRVQWEEALDKWGYTQRDQNLLWIQLERRPTLETLVSFELRGLITKDQLFDATRALGFEDKWVEPFRTIARIPVSPAELVQMAVREVFNPEIAEAFGQFEEIPKQFLEHARVVGLPDEWARNIWAAHWRLPSVQQAFEMMHRKVITPEEMAALFVAQDVMPFWRDKLSAISFSPFTRIDIRRMHRVGELTPAEVFIAYQDIGYDEVKAQKLTDFTIKLNTVEIKEVEEKERDLTKADLLGLYKDELLDRGAAGVALISIGFDTVETELLLARVDVQLERSARQEKIASIMSLFESGQSDLAMTQDALGTIDLTPGESARLNLKLQRQQEIKARLPTKGNLDTFLKTELIDKAQYTETMRLLGFADKWIDLYIAVIERGIDDESAEESDTD